MNAPCRICVVTGSRADYGLLYWILCDLRDADDFDLQLVVTGQHLAPEFGYTVRVVREDGFSVSDRVDCLISGDSARAVTKSLGLGVIGFADAYANLSPQIVLVLGDRFEIFAAAQAAMIANIPIAHIAGGDTTEGAFDEAIRHGITKMAHVHFVTNELSASRVRQLGECPESIHVVGNPGIDYIRRLRLLNRSDLEQHLAARLRPRNLLITFHPVTLGESLQQLDELLFALDALGDSHGLFFTGANADTGGRELNARVQKWVAERSHARFYPSLGQMLYLSLMAQVSAVVGNSSSGLYEAPSLRIPTVNVGERQRGRLAASSVIHSEPDRFAIRRAIESAHALDCSNVESPYGDGYAAQKILAQLRSLGNPRRLLKKHFHMLPERSQ